MNHAWKTRRTLVPQTDGQRRWDQAYQLLLQWTQTSISPPPPITEEVTHASSDLCARLDPATDTNPDH